MRAQERRWARSYQEGGAALNAEDWPTAVQKFEELFAEAPDFEDGAGGSVRNKLYIARLSWGQALLEVGAYADAAQRCQQALDLAPGSADAHTCLNAALASMPTTAPVLQPSAAPGRTGLQ